MMKKSMLYMYVCRYKCEKLVSWIFTSDEWIIFNRTPPRFQIIVSSLIISEEASPILWVPIRSMNADNNTKCYFAVIDVRVAHFVLSSVLDPRFSTHAVNQDFVGEQENILNYPRDALEARFTLPKADTRR